jgi:hypothetical protein
MATMSAALTSWPSVIGLPLPTCARASSTTAVVTRGRIFSMPSLSSGESAAGFTSRWV